MQSAQKLDQRLVRLGVEVGGEIRWYSDLAIWASGTKFGNENQNEAEFKIANLDRETRNYLLTETSPFNKNKAKKKIYLDVGRESYGTARLYAGEITSATISQPPDITLTLKAATSDNQKGNVISRAQPGMAKLSSISKQVATDIGAQLVFEASDKLLSNYSFAGAALKQVDKLAKAGSVDAFIDDEILVVKNMGVPLENRMTVLNLESGMIGQPEFTERGIKVTYLIDRDTTLGGALKVESKLNPAVNGTYNIYKLGFDVASRDTAFYFVAEASRTDGKTAKLDKGSAKVSANKINKSGK